jgi:hypothetical protein
MKCVHVKTTVNKISMLSVLRSVHLNTFLANQALADVGFIRIPPTFWSSTSQRLHGIIQTPRKTTMPPSTSAGDPRMTKTEHVATTAELLEHLHTRVQNLVGQQEELSETRERILIERERFTTAGKRVRLQRGILGEAEANLMNAFREHHNSRTTLVVCHLDLAYQAVQDARNKLVELEDDCEHIQDALGAAEWELMDMENELYQYELQQLVAGEAERNTGNLVKAKPPTPVPPSTTIFPSIKVQLQVATAQHDRLVREFDRLRLSYSAKDQPAVTHAGLRVTRPPKKELVDGLIWDIMESDVKVRTLKAGLAPGEGTILSRYQTRSDAGVISEPGPGVLLASPRAYSDGTLRKVSDDVPSKYLVDLWLLECLKTSGMERIQYQSLLERELQYLNVGMFGTGCWEENAQNLWLSSDVNVLELTGLATSIVQRIFGLETHLDVVRETENTEDNYVGLAVHRQSAHTSIRTRIPGDIIQWFTGQPRLNSTSLQVDSAIFIDHIGAWAESGDVEDPRTLCRSVQDRTTGIKEESVTHNMYDFANGGQKNIACSDIQYSVTAEHTTQPIEPLEEWMTGSNNSESNLDSMEDGKHGQSCSNLVGDRGTQRMRGAVLEVLSSPSR